jgi:hypothetical protein
MVRWWLYSFFALGRISSVRENVYVTKKRSNHKQHKCSVHYCTVCSRSCVQLTPYACLRMMYVSSSGNNGFTQVLPHNPSKHRFGGEQGSKR